MVGLPEHRIAPDAVVIAVAFLVLIIARSEGAFRAVFHADAVLLLGQD